MIGGIFHQQKIAVLYTRGDVSPSPLPLRIRQCTYIHTHLVLGGTVWCGYYYRQVLPRVIWEECVALAQLRKNVPIGYNRTPKIHPQNCPFPCSCMHWLSCYFPHVLYARRSSKHWVKSKYSLNDICNAHWMHVSWVWTPYCAVLQGKTRNGATACTERFFQQTSRSNLTFARCMYDFCCPSSLSSRSMSFPSLSVVLWRSQRSPDVHKSSVLADAQWPVGGMTIMPPYRCRAMY